MGSSLGGSRFMRWLLPGFTGLVVAFLFAPIVVMIVFSFNHPRGHQNITWQGFTLDNYTNVWSRPDITDPMLTSLTIAIISTVVATIFGTLIALSLTRYEFRGKEAMNTLVIMPALVPETILGVGLLLLMKWLHQPRSYMLLVLGHIMLALPFVVLVVQARLIGIKRVYEEASLSLGANRFNTFREVTLPLLMPAIIASILLVFTISFDNITASLFWRPPGVETMPTQILAMLKISISPEINALGTLMILITVGLPLAGGLIGRILFGNRQ